MKKIQLNKLETINGGVIKCGWVGVGAVISHGLLMTVPLIGASGLYSLSDDIGRCWNS